MEAQLSDMSEWLTIRSSKPNCPVSAAVPQTRGTSLTVSFRYDPFRRRIQKTSLSGVTNYLYDGANIVAEVSSSGGVVASYAQGAGIDEPLAMQRSGSTVYYHADGLGSVTSLTNTSATTVATYVYDSFGKTTATGSIVNPFRFTGRENDSERGLYYYRARYYDQALGRFINEDPIRYSDGTNFYAYVKNSPIARKDPSGLCGCTDAPSLPSSSPACDAYGSEPYWGASMKCFCKCAGESAWAQQVRGRKRMGSAGARLPCLHV